MDRGKWVLFSGTPCQIAGLKKYLQKDYERLIAVDIICHGVPSPKIWNDYLTCVTNKYGKEKKLYNISFRDKSKGWEKYRIAFTFRDSVGNTRTYSQEHSHNTYFRLFNSGLILRPSCYNCVVKNGNSNSDITLADFWGITSIVPDFYDNKGVSLVIVNSKKASLLFQDIFDKSVPVPFKKAISHNPAFSRPAPLHPQRSDFFNDYYNKNINIITLFNKYSGITLKANLELYLNKVIAKVKHFFS